MNTNWYFDMKYLTNMKVLDTLFQQSWTQSISKFMIAYVLHASLSTGWHINKKRNNYENLGHHKYNTVKLCMYLHANSVNLRSYSVLLHDVIHTKMKLLFCDDHRNNLLL